MKKTLQSFSLTLVIGLVITVFCHQYGYAATFTVNTTNDLLDATPGNGLCDDGSGNCALRAAIQEANAWGGSDTIILGPGTFGLTYAGINEDACLTGDLDITSVVVIQGANARTTIIDANSLDRVFHILSGRLIASQITITGGSLTGNHGAGIRNNNRILELIDVSITNCAVTGNSSGGAWGGGIYSDQGSVTLERVTISGCSSTGGNGDNGVQPGGGAGGGGGAGMGGAIYADGAGTIAITNSTISGNTAIGGRGGQASFHSGSGTTASNGGRGGNGGGNGGAASGGAGQNGGFGAGGGGGASITGQGGNGGFGGGGGGGGASSWGGTAGTRGTGGTFGGDGSSSCCSGGSGGGGGAGLGGAIMNNGGTLTLTNTTIAMNMATGGARGTGWFSTNSQNGDGVGAGVMNYSGTVNLNNTLVANNVSTSSDPDVYGTFTSTNGHNLVQNSGSATIGGNTTGNQLNVNARIDTFLLNNGGHTNTHALIPCGPPSPAIDAGTATAAPANDQRDTARLNGVDIGSFEANQVFTSEDTISQLICGGATYSFNGQNLSMAGFYYDTLTNYIGCDSFLTLDLSLSFPTPVSFNDSVCAGSSYWFGGNSYSTGGTYYDTIAGYGGCDSIISLQLSLIAANSSNVTDSMCHGGMYNFNGSMLSSAGNYVDTLPGSGGCDSFVYLTLWWSQRPITNITDSICHGGTYNFLGSVISSSGNYSDTIPGYGSCDSIVNLNLLWSQRPVTNFTDSICHGGTYTFLGSALNSSGNYSDTIPGYASCDSIVNLNLLWSHRPVVSINDSICDGDQYSFGGSWYTSAGVYYDTLSGFGGCDSVVRLNLTMFQIPVSGFGNIGCAGDTMQYYGKSYTTNGIYFDTLTSVNGCDSIIRMLLTFTPPSVDVVSASICQGETYFIGANPYTTAGFYVDTVFGVATWGCDSIIQLTLTVVDPSISVTNIQAGCDSISVSAVALDGMPPYTYAWSDGSTSYNTWNGAYQSNLSVTITDDAGCQVNTSVNIPFPVITVDQTNVSQISCFGEEDASISLVASGGEGSLTYYWPSLGVYDVSLNDLSAGTYIVMIEDQTGCERSDTFVIADKLELTLSIFPEEETVDLGQSILLSATSNPGNAAFIEWTPPLFLDDYQSYNVVCTPSDDINYFVTVTDSNGCKATATASISIAPHKVLIPNAFTPNSDGNNDFFRIAHFPENFVNRVSARVWNRWGQRIYEYSGSENFSWDGTYKGLDQPIGTYSYSVEVEIEGAVPVYVTGNITLLR